MDKLEQIKKAIPLKTKQPPAAGKRRSKATTHARGLEHQKITPQIDKFCKEYVINLCNGAEAVRRSFPTIKTANSAASKASQLLRSINIQNHISKIKENAEESTGISKTFMIQELLDISDGHVEIVSSKEEYDKMPENRKKAVKKVEWETYETDKNTTVKRLKVEYYSKLECFKLIADILGYTQKQAAQVIIQQNNLFGDAEKEFKKSIEI